MKQELDCKCYVMLITWILDKILQFLLCQNKKKLLCVTEQHIALTCTDS